MLWLFLRSHLQIHTMQQSLIVKWYEIILLSEHQKRDFESVSHARYKRMPAIVQEGAIPMPPSKVNEDAGGLHYPSSIPGNGIRVDSFGSDTMTFLSRANTELHRKVESRFDASNGSNINSVFG